MQEMTEAAIRNNEAMKQVAYIFLLFRPADSIAVSTVRYLLLYNHNNNVHTP